MKSGSKKSSAMKHINLKDYENAHANHDCRGSFEFKFSKNTPYPVDALGQIILPFVPYIACEECQTALPFPGWDDFLEKQISFHLIGNKKLLSKAQMRFLRLASDQTQADVADKIGMDRSLFNKKESESNEAHYFNASEQVQLKLLYSKILGIRKANFIYNNMIKLDENTERLTTLTESDFDEFLPLKSAYGK